MLGLSVNVCEKVHAKLQATAAVTVGLSVAALTEDVSISTQACLYLRRTSHISICSGMQSQMATLILLDEQVEALYS